MLPLLLIFTFFIFIYNLGVYLPAILFGVRVEKFYVWKDAWISLFKIKIGHTEFGMGWFPIGGYVTFSGTYVKVDEEIKPYFFKAVSRFKQVLITTGGPFLCLIIGLIAYAILTEIPSFVIFKYTIFQIIIVGVWLLLFKFFTRKSEKKENLRRFRKYYYAGALLYYLVLLFSFHS